MTWCIVIIVIQDCIHKGKPVLLAAHTVYFVAGKLQSFMKVLLCNMKFCLAEQKLQSSDSPNSISIVDFGFVWNTKKVKWNAIKSMYVKHKMLSDTFKSCAVSLPYFALYICKHDIISVWKLSINLFQHWDRLHHLQTKTSIRKRTMFIC